MTWSKTPLASKCFTSVPNLSPFLLYRQPFLSKVPNIDVPHKIPCFALWTVLFESRQFWNKCMTIEWQNDLEHYKVKVLLVPLSPKFRSVLLYSQPFLSYQPFWDEDRMIPKWPWTVKRWKFTPCVSYNLLPSPKFQSFFAVWSPVLELPAYLREVHWMTQKWPWTQGQKVSQSYSTRTPPPPCHKFQSVLLYGQPFSSYRNFQTSALNDPRMTEHYEVKGTPYMSY